MSNTTTALSFDSIDHTIEIALQRQPPRIRARVPAPRLFQRSAEAIAVIALAPLVLAAISTLLLVFIAKLLVALVATGFEH